MDFKNYKFKDYIKKAVEELGFKEFTDVQQSVFDNLKTNKNILAKSRTGSGKTHAFLLPIFNDLDENLNEVQATIIAPTKELSMQIYKVAQHIASFSPNTINIKLFSGGTDRLKEIESSDYVIYGLDTCRKREEQKKKGKSFASLESGGSGAAVDLRARDEGKGIFRGSLIN